MDTKPLFEKPSYNVANALSKLPFTCFRLNLFVGKCQVKKNDDPWKKSPVNKSDTCLYCTVSSTVLVHYTDVGGEGGCNVNIEMVSTPVNNCTVVLLVNPATPLCIRGVESCWSFTLHCNLHPTTTLLQYGGNKGRGGKSKSLWKSLAMVITRVATNRTV